MPGGLTGWASWEPHVEPLSGSRKVVRLQLLNVQYGLENRGLPDNYSVKTESDALFNTLIDLGLEGPADVAAWSFGALISLDYALDHVERIRTLTLIEPPALWLLRTLGTPDAAVRHHESVVRTLHGDISEEQLELFLSTVGICPPGKSPRELPQWPSWMTHRQSLRNSHAVVDHTDDPRRLRALKRPVLLVRGTGSAGYFHQIIDLLSAELPNARVTEMPAGHAPHIVSRDRFLRELAAWIGF
jgi:pimeloyl-ACP methyl ester carboxylesterase